jgi:HTH-type transcriptional regulator / antitoxin HigA
MNIKPIRTDVDHAEAVRRIEKLWGAAPGTPDGDALDVLATLVDAYEAKRWPETPVEPIAFLRTFMNETGRAQADLAELLGSRSRASEVLARKRGLTLDMVARLNREWGVPADVLVQSAALARVA